MFFLAVRHLSSRKKQTALMLMGVTLGAAGYVTITGIMMGFQTFIIDQLVNNDSHVRISAREEYITEHSLDTEFFPDAPHVFWVSPPSGRRDNAYILNPQGWFERLDRDNRVLSYSPQFVVQGIASRAKVSLSARIVGSDPARQVRVTNIDSYMTSGNFRDIGTTGNRIVVGDGLLRKLGARVSETVLLSVGKGEPVSFHVVGAFHLGIKSLDESTIFAALSDVQKINRTPSQISDVAVRLADVRDAEPLALDWSAISADKVLSWNQANEGTMSVFKTQDIVRYSMTIAILAVAGFGIYNMLNMAISNKRREIAILRSVGFEPNDVLLLFLAQGLILGAAGGLVGAGLGFVACKIISMIPVSANRGLGGNTMLVSFDLFIYARGFGLAFLAATVASLIPARGAGKLTPIDIIRSEST